MPLTARGLSRARCGPSGLRSPGDGAAAAPSAGEGPGAAEAPAPTCGHPRRRRGEVPGPRAAARLLRDRCTNLAARVGRAPGNPPAALGEPGGSSTRGPGSRIRGTPRARTARCPGRAPGPWEPPPASPGVRAERLARPNRPSPGPRGGGSGPGDPAASLGARCARRSPPQRANTRARAPVKPADSAVSGGNLHCPCLSALETLQDKRGSHPCQSRVTQAGLRRCRAAVVTRGEG